MSCCMPCFFILFVSCCAASCYVGFLLWYVTCVMSCIAKKRELPRVTRSFNSGGGQGKFQLLLPSLQLLTLNCLRSTSFELRRTERLRKSCSSQATTSRRTLPSWSTLKRRRRKSNSFRCRTTGSAKVYFYTVLTNRLQTITRLQTTI